MSVVESRKRAQSRGGSWRIAYPSERGRSNDGAILDSSQRSRMEYNNISPRSNPNP